MRRKDDGIIFIVDFDCYHLHIGNVCRFLEYFDYSYNRCGRFCFSKLYIEKDFFRGDNFTMNLKIKFLIIIVLVIFLYMVIVIYLAWQDGAFEIQKNVNFCSQLIENITKIPLI